MIAIYIAALLFGGILIGGSFLGGDGGGTDSASGGAGGHLTAGDSHGSASVDHAAAHHPWSEGGLGLLLGIRFWSFAVAFFGLTGLILRALRGPEAPLAILTVAAVVGVAAGVAASRIMRRFTRDSVGAVRGASALVGREGTLLLPVARDQRGKVRLPLPGGGHVDLVAESSGDDAALLAGADVLVVEVRENAVLVSPTPAAARPK